MAVIGPKWIPAAGVLKILSVLGMSLIFIYFTGPLLQALSRTRELAFLEWARMAVGTTLLLTVGFYVQNRSVEWQIGGIALARFFTGALVVTPVFVYIFMRLTKISLRDLGTSIASSAIASAAIVISVMLLSASGLLSKYRPTVVLAAEVVVGTIVGSAVILKLEADLRELVIASFRRMSAPQLSESKDATPKRSATRTCEGNLMKVSVVIPTYNRAYILGDALESVLAQTYPDYEIIVVDDGSTDKTRELIESYQNGKIRYIRHEHNRGCSAAYNTGIDAASGNFIAMLDSDDQWKREYLERQVNFYRQHPEADIVFTNTELIDGSTRITYLMDFMPCFRGLLKRRQKEEEYIFSAREMYLCLLEEVPVKPSAALIRREKLDQVGGFDEAWPSGTDWDLLLRLSKVSCFGYIDRALAVQRRTSDATHWKFREKDKLFLLEIFLKEKAMLTIDSEALRHINRGIYTHYNSLAWTYLQTGRAKEALETYFRGLRESWQPKMPGKRMLERRWLPRSDWDQ